MSQEENTSASLQPAFWQRYTDFTVKLMLLTVVVSLGITYAADSIFNSFMDTVATQFNMTPLRDKLRATLSDEKTRVRLKGLLTTNPAVHYRVAAIEERDGNVVAAIEDIELALGLLEMHGADRATKEKYTSRLQELKRKLGASSSGNAGLPQPKQ